MASERVSSGRAEISDMALQLKRRRTEMEGTRAQLLLADAELLATTDRLVLREDQMAAVAGAISLFLPRDERIDASEMAPDQMFEYVMRSLSGHRLLWR